MVLAAAPDGVSVLAKGVGFGRGLHACAIEDLCSSQFHLEPPLDIRGVQTLGCAPLRSRPSWFSPHYHQLLGTGILRNSAIVRSGQYGRRRSDYLLDAGSEAKSPVTKQLRQRVRATSQLGTLYPRSYIRSIGQGSLFAQPHVFCMFIGCPRSGHSLIGSLLDAHPQMAIAHELDVLRFVRAHFSRRQLFQLILDNVQLAAKAGRVQTGYSGPGAGRVEYSYAVPNQWQGKWQELKVVGDKKAGESTKRLGAKPELLDDLTETVRLPLRLIHVFRNPYDNISTMASRRSVELSVAIRSYFSRCKTVAGISEGLPEGQVHHLSHESFIDDPEQRLAEVCRFLEVPAERRYLQDCARIVYPAPHASRLDAPWTSDLIRGVEKEMARFPFLEGYTFDHVGVAS
jgi:Sulfotransferase family